MAALNATTSASGTSDGSPRVVDGSVLEPHEYRDAERTLTRLLELMRGGRVPVQLLPLLDNFHAAVSADPAWRCHLLALFSGPYFLLLRKYSVTF